MPAVFVHGVPDTPEVWDAVVSRLQRKKTRARFVPVAGGLHWLHWWQLERPAEVAAELERHWSAV